MKHVGMLVLLVVGTVDAGELHRCVGPARDVSYQSAACPVGHRTDRTIAFTPDAASPAVAPSRRESPPRYLGRPAAPRRNASKANTIKATRVDPCAQAKANREQALSRLGLNRTYDQLSRLDAKVRAVCNGY